MKGGKIEPSLLLIVASCSALYISISIPPSMTFNGHYTHSVLKCMHLTSSSREN